MKAAELRKFKQLLMSEREKLLEQLNFDREQVKDLSKNDSGDIVDRAFSMYEKNRAIATSENEKKMLKHIDAALLRIEKKTFGKCVYCREAIGVARLTALPWAVACHKCQSKR